MPTNITPVNQKTLIRSPLDGEVASAADLIAQLSQPVSNQIENVRQRTFGLADLAFIPVDIENGGALGGAWDLRNDLNPSFRHYWRQLDRSAEGYNLLIEITSALPMSGKIVSVGCECYGATRDPAILPSYSGAMPCVYLRRATRFALPSSAGDRISAYTTVDNSATYSSYTAPHRFSAAPDSSAQENIDISTYRYFLEIRGEGPDQYSANGFIVYGAFVAVGSV